MTERQHDQHDTQSSSDEEGESSWEWTYKYRKGPVRTILNLDFEPLTMPTKKRDNKKDKKLKEKTEFYTATD